MTRSRACDSAGACAGAERPLVSPPTTASDASIAAFAGGFAVSYRADNGDGMGPQIMLALVDFIGEVHETIPVAPAAATGGRTTIRVTGTGDLAIAWADEGAASTDLFAQVIPCGVRP